MTTMATTAITKRYETLRAAVLARHLGTDRRGLALLCREGMAAWAAAWTLCSPAPVARAEADCVGTFAEPTGIVSLLASMALSTLQEHPS
jgi:hypothetical protein